MTAQTAKKTVVNIESQNWPPRVPGGQCTVPPAGLLHCSASQWV